VGGAYGGEKIKFSGKGKLYKAPGVTSYRGADRVGEGEEGFGKFNNEKGNPQRK